MARGETVTLTLPDGAVVDSAPVTVPTGGVLLTLTLPAGRHLDSAHLELATAAPVSEAAMSPVAITTDSGQLGGAVRWIAAELAHEVVLTGLQIDANTADAIDKSARIRLLSRGAWVPLAPIDTIAVGSDQRVTAVTASRVIAELLIPAADKSPVGVPGPAKVTGLKVTGTNQACNVCLAVGDDAPFFTLAGPLPTSSVPVEGLARALTRYLIERPGSNVVPLRLTAGGPAQVVIAAFSATLAPLPPQPEVSPQPGSPLLPIETIYLQSATPDVGRAQLCDSGHTVAQSFDKLPPGRSLSSIGLYLQCGAGSLSATVAIYPDTDGVPASAPVTGGVMAFASNGSPYPVAGFVICRPVEPLTLASGSWWLVSDVTQGEFLWFTGEARPSGAGRTLTRTLGGTWIPAPAVAPQVNATDSGWAQAVLRTVPASTDQSA